MTRLTIWLGTAALVAAVLFLAAPVSAAPQFPALSGRVVDGAHILSEASRAQLTQKLAALETTTTRQLVVVTLPDLQGYDIADFGYQLGRSWGIGQKSENNGVLFIIAPTERSVRIEVGYGLEPILTDALSSVILNQTVMPRFRAGDMEGGIVAGTDLLIEQLSLDEQTAMARAQEAKEAQSNEFNPFVVLVILFIVLSVFGRLFGGRRRGWWWLPLLFLNGGGRRGGGGFGGGGFGGGGGSFGGGGASGRW